MAIKVGHIARTPSISVTIRPHTYSYIMFNRYWMDKFIYRDSNPNEELDLFVATVKQHLKENKRFY